MRQIATNVFDLENVTLTNIAEGSASAFPRPTALKAESIHKGAIRLTWVGTKPAEAVYMIYRSKDGIQFHYHALSFETVYLDSRIETGRAYQYRVRVSSLEGTSVFSDVARVLFPK